MTPIPLSMTTDYLQDDDFPKPYLHKIADAGFTHIHWGHQWNTDTIYIDSDIDQIQTWLQETHLQVYGVHGSTGRERCWYSDLENKRLAGVELVKNRIRLAASLDCSTVIMHISCGPQQAEALPAFLTHLYHSLDAVRPYAADFGVRLAIENEVDWERLARINAAPHNNPVQNRLNLRDNFDLITRVLSNYEPDFLGLCYDSGHGNIGYDRSSAIESLKDRLIAVHLHDNDGSGDQHLLPFEGSVNWAKITRIIASSPHSKTLNIESNLPQTGQSETIFLKQAHQAGEALSEMVASHLHFAAS
jgi:sugar phosphate isomerase/epimerase